MKSNNYYFGQPSVRFRKALVAVMEANKAEHPVLDNVYVGFKKLPVDAPQKEKQVVIQTIDTETTDNGFIRYQTFGISVYAKTFDTIEELSADIEGCLSLVSGQQGIRYAEVILGFTETRDSFAALSNNQSTLEDWRLITCEVSLTPIPFNKA